MRDPNRIDRMIEILRKYWKNNPDLRLGQIIFNANYHVNHNSDCFYIEDDKLEAELVSMLNEENKG